MPEHCAKVDARPLRIAGCDTSHDLVKVHAGLTERVHCQEHMPELADNMTLKY